MFIEAKHDGGGGDNWTTGAINRAKLQSNHRQQTNIQFYRPDALPVAQPKSVKALKEKKLHPVASITNLNNNNNNNHDDIYSAVTFTFADALFAERSRN